MNPGKSASLQSLRRTVEPGREGASVAAASAVPEDKPDEEALRRMAEELQQKINKRNLDYGIRKPDADGDVSLDDSAMP